MLEEPVSFGLAQQALVDNILVDAPLNAGPAPLNESASFVPTENVSIFPANFAGNGSVLSQVSPNALLVSLRPQAPTAVIGFRDRRFYLQSPLDSELDASSQAFS
jgi:hypothetical protein